MSYPRYRIRPSHVPGYFVGEVKTWFLGFWHRIYGKDGWSVRASLEEAEEICRMHKEGKLLSETQYLDI